MKVGYPYMGTVIVYKKLLETMGHEVVETPRPTRQTIALGVKHSPEFACFPYKTIMGSYIELAKKGVEMIVTSGGRGPCRAGLYEQLHRRTLQSLGYDIDVVNFDLYKKNWAYALRSLRKTRGKASLFKALKAFILVYDMIHSLDRLERIVETRRAYEAVPGSFTAVWKRINETYDRHARTLRDVRRFEKEFSAELLALPVKEIPESEKIRIGIVGEIYVVMESAINLNIEEVLNGLGCEVRRDLYLSGWVNDNLFPFLNRGHEKQILKKSRRYMEIKIGGHENETIGHIIDYKEKEFDGIVHLMPFACLPELITQSILPKVSKDLDIPVLSLSLDEQTAIANQRTRIEAFVDLLHSKKREAVRQGRVETAAEGVSPLDATKEFRNLGEADLSGGHR